METRARTHDARLQLALRYLRAGLAQLAIEQLRDVLGEDPESAYAHALLAHALVDDDRLFAAEHEAGLALAADPESGEGHRAMARVLLAQRKPDEALDSLERSQVQDPLEPATFRIRGTVLAAMERNAEAREALEKARELDPEDLEAPVQLGELSLSEGDAVTAERLAREVLQVDAQHVGALVLMGGALLRRGDVAPARVHVIAALQENAGHAGAIRLLVSLKSRESVWLGAWWHFNTRVSELSAPRMVLALAGVYVVTELVKLALLDLGLPLASEIVDKAWLATCVYTWVAPRVFRSMLDKELRGVTLRDDF